MSSDEIDIWYDSQKEDIFSDYLKDIEESKDRKDSEERFLKRMNKLRRQYLKKYDKLENKK